MLDLQPPEVPLAEGNLVVVHSLDEDGAEDIQAHTVVEIQASEESEHQAGDSVAAAHKQTVAGVEVPRGVLQVHKAHQVALHGVASAVEVQSEGEVALHEVAWHVVELHVVALHVVAGEVDKRVVGKLRVVHLVQVAQPHPEVALPMAGDVPQMEEHLVGIDHLRSLAEHLVAEDLVVVLPSDHLVGYSARDLVVVDPVVAHPVVAHPVVAHPVVVHLVVVHLVVAHPVVVHLVVVRPVVAVQHHVPLEHPAPSRRPRRPLRKRSSPPLPHLKEQLVLPSLQRPWLPLSRCSYPPAWCRSDLGPARPQTWQLPDA